MNKSELTEIKLKLTDESYKKPYKGLKKVFKLDRIDDDLLDFILGLEDELVVSEFLQNFDNFNEDQLNTVERFIENNLTNRDRLFVSDLIGVANSWNIISIYQKCIDFICDDREDSLVILESIYMVFEHLQLDLIKEIFEALKGVINSKEYYQNCQTAAAFYLLRISGHKQYLDDVISYVEKGQDETNSKILKNLLSEDYNQQEYFAHHDKLISVIK